MALSLTPPTPLEYFSTLVQSDRQFPLLEVVISLGLDEYPGLDVQQVLSEVDQLLDRVQRRLPADASALHRLRVLNQFFFQDLRFGGNANDYYNPDNSYLNIVLHSRRGIPVSLAVLWLELAQGLGLNAGGVSFPGHFMAKVNLPEGQVVIDPLSGQSLSREELSERLVTYLSPTVHGDEVPLGAYLRVATARDIVARMLRNLKEIHHAQEDWARMVAVQNRLLILLPQAWDEHRDRGLAWAELGQTRAAVQDMEIYLEHAEEGPDRRAIVDRIAELRRRTA